MGTGGCPHERRRHRTAGGESGLRYRNASCGAAPHRFRQNTFPLDGTSETAVELSIAPEEYPSFFLPGSPPEVAAAAAVSQRPLAASALFVDKASAAAWRTMPSWAIIAAGDESIHPDAQRFMAERAAAQTIEVPGPHTVMVSEPARVADHIRGAMRALR